LFCFSHAGGGASVFGRWWQYLPENVELWAIQPPGRESRLGEAPLTRIPEAVALLGEEFLRLLDVPFALFGHSLGAHIGFELARLLRRKNLVGPVHLFASASRAPQLPDPDPPISHLPEQEFLDELCQRCGGIPQEVLDNADLLEIVMIALRADCEMCETYRFQPERPLECPITVLGGDADYLKYDELAAWREQTADRFRLHMFPGGHFFIRDREEQIPKLISQALRATIAFA